MKVAAVIDDARKQLAHLGTIEECVVEGNRLRVTATDQGERFTYYFQIIIITQRTEGNAEEESSSNSTQEP